MDSPAQNYQRFLSGDESGLTQIIRTYADGITLYLNGFVQDLHVAEELTEDTFVKLVLKRPHLQKDHAFKTWLYTIAGNVARDYLRRHKNRLVSLDECAELADAEELENRYIQKEERLQLHSAMKKLKREYQQILWLIYFEDFSYKEAGRIMGKSTHSAETLAYRARQALKNKLYEEGYVYEEL